MSAPRPLPDAFVERLRAKDASLFSDDPAEQAAIADRLGWVDAPERMRARLPEIDALVDGVRADGFDRALVLGMGGSSLAAEVFGEVYRGTPGGLDVRVCDSTVPSAVRAATAWADLGRCLFLVSSKSGTTAEVDALYRHFRFTHDDGARFVAITDPGTPLAQLSTEERFRACVLGFPDVGGRFSALTPFGLVPAALAGGQSLAEEARSSDSAQLLGERLPTLQAAIQGHRLAQARYGHPALTEWTEQLFAESTGKRGRGVLPVAADHRAVDPTHLTLASEMFAQMFDCAALCWTIGVNPFDQPDVESAKRRTREQLERVGSGGALHAPPSADHRAVRALLDGARDTDEYVGLLAFVHRTSETDAAFEAMRLLNDARGLATSVGYGPRYLHSTGQFHKGGRDCGVFVIITADDTDLPIPGRPYGFQTLCLAQAYGDFQALTDAGRRVVHWHCGADVEGGLAQLRDAFAPGLV